MPDDAGAAHGMQATPLVSIESLVHAHHAAVYRYAYRLTGTAHDADDFTQQTYLLAQRSLGQLRSAEQGRSWLFAILRNAWLKSLKRRAPQPACDLELDPNEIAERWPTASEIDHERLQQALDELSPEFRVVLLMFFFEDLSYREIAEKLNVPPGTVMSRLARAKQHLRGRIMAAEFKEVARRARAISGQGG